MKKKLIRVACIVAMIAVILIILEVTADTQGNGLISPSCEVLAAEHGMIKHGMKYSGISFSRDDFTKALGTESIQSITVLSLPDASSGTLLLGDTYVVKNQIIEAEKLDALRFVSSNSEASDSGFTFSANNNAYDIYCSMVFTESINFAPKIDTDDAVSVWTQQNISCHGTLTGEDPEQDELTYEIVAYPEKGLLSLDKSSGSYQFYPYENVKGVDKFEYRVRDSYGNYSETATVAIEIDSIASNIIFTDMVDHEAHNAAILAIAENRMSYTEKDGKYYFSPDEAVSREEFLVCTMDLLGAKNVPQIKSSGFADDSDISTNAKGYVASAYFLGVVSGDMDNGQLYFRPKDAVTKAEAAVIVNNILGFEPTISASTFSDADSIPVWAVSSLCAMNELGIMRTEDTGAIGANETLTRAQVAQLIMSLINYTGN